MIKDYFNLDTVHPTWQTCLKQALQQINPHYLEKLQLTQNWLPGPQKIFNAFSLPVTQVNYLLFGESPYPRAASANGYAFWDAAVTELWSAQGLSKQVNRATSLRNLIKMLLVAEGLLKPPHLGQMEIAALPKTQLIHTNDQLFKHFLDHGFLLLNASLVLHEQVQKDAAAWRPFIKHVVEFLLQERPQLKLILFGKIANVITRLFAQPLPVDMLCVEHPYNCSFIVNQQVLDFFRHFHLLRA